MQSVQRLEALKQVKFLAIAGGVENMSLPLLARVRLKVLSAVTRRSTIPPVAGVS